MLGKYYGVWYKLRRCNTVKMIYIYITLTRTLGILLIHAQHEFSIFFPVIMIIVRYFMDESRQYLWNEFRQVNYSYIIRNYMPSPHKHLGS